MKAVIFGGTGFIGGHVAEHLDLAGHQVTAAVRETSNTAFLESFGVNVVRIDFSNRAALAEVIKGHDVVYNCTADAQLNSTVHLEAEVEVKLTRTLMEAAASQGASRFVQLSTIVIYDFRSNEPMDESYMSQPEYPIQRLGLERENIVREIGRKTGMTTLILRPASTIGVRDTKSFFARLYTAHVNGRYPMIGNGDTKVSLVDTRDIGRAMVWLGTFQKPAHDNGIYLLKGFDTTWKQLKRHIDHARGIVAKTVELPGTLTEEQMVQYHLSPFALKTFTVNRLWNDNKIRNLGFETRYSLAEAVDASVKDLSGRSVVRT